LQKLQNMMNKFYKSLSNNNKIRWGIAINITYQFWLLYNKQDLRLLGEWNVSKINQNYAKLIKKSELFLNQNFEKKIPET